MDLAERVSCSGRIVFTFPALEDKLRLYQQQNFVQLWIRDSRTVSAAKKHLTRNVKDSLCYYEIKYCCIQEGLALNHEEKAKELRRELV